MKTLTNDQKDLMSQLVNTVSLFVMYKQEYVAMLKNNKEEIETAANLLKIFATKLNELQTETGIIYENDPLFWVDAINNEV